MSDVKQTITNTENRGVNENGAAVEQQTKQIHTEAASDPQLVAKNIIWFLLGIIEVLLLMRFVLKLTGANPASGFVDFVYAASGWLSAPFDSIFGVTAAKAGAVVESVFEPSILVAALVYALLAWGIVKLLTINRKQV